MASARTAKTWSQALEDLIAGKRNPRALVLQINTQLKGATRHLAAIWQISMSTPEPITDENGHTIRHTWRKRRPDELPENDPAAWADLRTYAQALRVTAEALETYAAGEHDKAVMRRNAERSLSA